jgi:anti-anti-sigma factor
LKGRKNENCIIRIIIEGRLDADSAPKAEKFIKKTLKRKKTWLLFDLCALDYMSSAGLRIILKAAKEIYRRDGKIVFCCLNEPKKDILECSQFPFADSVEAGIKKFSS